MKRWIALYIVVSVLAYSLPGNLTVSILQIGNLISHFHDHHSGHHDHNIFKFIATHYLDGKHHDADHDNHEKLPFHNHDNSTQGSSVQTPSLLPQSLSYISSIGLLSSSYIQPATSSRFTSSFIGDIWQPPKA
jgi:hypothetical protein